MKTRGELQEWMRAGCPVAETAQPEQRRVPEVRVQVVASPRARPFAVLGEVEKGGVFEVRYPMTVLRALALAGGPTDRAHLTQVLLIRKNPNGEPGYAVLDLQMALAGEDPFLATTAMIGNDVLFVPIKPIARVNVFIDQYFRKMWPIETGLGFGVRVQ